MKSTTSFGLLLVLACAVTKPSQGDWKADKIASNAQHNQDSLGAAFVVRTDSKQDEARGPKPDNNKGSDGTVPNQPVTITNPDKSPVNVNTIKDRWDKALVVGTVALVVVGGFGIRYAVKTLKSINRQADEMAKQRNAMEGQLTAMQGQLAAMEGSSKQTDTLIQRATEQTESIRKQALLMEGQLNETQRQVQHLVNAERAWIQVPEILKMQALSTWQFGPDTFFVWLHPYIINNGRTQARITAISARAHILPKIDDSLRPPILPEAPQFSDEHRLTKREIILSPKEGINWINVSISREDVESIRQRRAFLYLYGRIDYKDISDKERQTGFGRIYWIPYANDPVFREDFVESEVIPPAYTECT